MKHTLITSLLSLICLTSFAQRAEVLSRMQITNEMSQVDVTYNNEFGKHRNDHLDDPFPFAVIRMDLEGDANDIREAKERITLDVGTMYRVEEIDKTKTNCILFLVKKGIKNVSLDCGDGCKRQELYTGNGLERNTIYVCRVRYYREEASAPTPSGPKMTSQYLVLNFEPKDAMVEIDGTIVETDEGVYSKLLPFGKHTYRISYNNYHTKTGTVTIGKEKMTLTEKLDPAYGWIKIDGPNGASVYIDGNKIGNAPKKSNPIASGTHDVQIVKEKYLSHREQVLVNDNTITTLNPTLIANFTTIKLTTGNNAEIWVNDEKKGTGSVTLDLEPGEYLFESRKESHRTQSIARKIDLTSSSTITIPEPIAIVGLLSINVNPVGAKIYLDNKYVGESPLMLDNIIVGRHKLRCVSDGLQDEEKDIEIKEGETREISLTMNKFSKEIEGRNDVSVIINKSERETSLQADPYKHHISISVPGVRKKGVLFKNDWMSITTDSVVDWDSVYKQIYRTHIEDMPIILRCLSMYSDPDKRLADFRGLQVAYSTLRKINIPIKATVNIDENKSRNPRNAVANIQLANGGTHTIKVYQRGRLSSEKTTMEWNPGAEGIVVEDRTLKRVPKDYKGIFVIGFDINSIGDSAFYGCSGITSVTIPKSVNSIGHCAFQGCSGLTNVTIPNCVNKINAGAFSGCSSLTFINIPNSLTLIDDGVFKGCSGLTNVTIPNSVKEISWHAFEGCTALTDIQIPDSVKYIGWKVFAGCSSLKNVTIPNSVKWIHDNAFEGCTGLTTITIPDSVTLIDKSAFKGCSSLKNVKLPNKLKEIKEYAFEGCSGLTSITIPDNVTSIERCAFKGCSGLQNITIPYSVKSIGMSAFRGCSGLKSVNILSRQMEYIEDYVFADCSRLSEVVIPNGIRGIGSHAFDNCTSLTSVTIPNSLYNIKGYAFKNCSSLSEIIFNCNSGVSIYSDAFEGCSSLKTIYVPKDSKKGFRNKMPRFKKIIKEKK